MSQINAYEDTVKTDTLPVNYSVKNIIDSILQDNANAQQYTPEQKKERYRTCIALLNTYPELKKILSLLHIRNISISGADRFARIGVLPPELVVVDQRIKNMCTMPYWTVRTDERGKPVRRFSQCPGYNMLPGCPPRSPRVETVQKLLDRSSLFIVIQTRLLSGRGEGAQWKFLVLHRLAADIAKILGSGAVVQKFGSGPCAACNIMSCMKGKTCGSPALKIYSLESMGVCVDALCSDLSFLTGNNDWEIRWLKHFGFKQQAPKKWKYVQAIALRL